VFDLDAPDASALKERSHPPITDAGIATRVDEMGLTSDGELLLTVNNAAEPPFATLFIANGDSGSSSVHEIGRITIDPLISPSPRIEQPAWDPKTKRFYVSVPVLGADGGLMVIDPPGSRAIRRSALSFHHEHRRAPAQRLRTERSHIGTARQPAPGVHSGEQWHQRQHARHQRDDEALHARERHRRLG